MSLPFLAAYICGIVLNIGPHFTQFSDFRITCAYAFLKFFLLYLARRFYCPGHLVIVDPLNFFTILADFSFVGKLFWNFGHAGRSLGH